MSVELLEENVSISTVFLIFYSFARKNVVFCFDSKTSFYLSISGHFVFHENPDIPHYNVADILDFLGANLGTPDSVPGVRPFLSLVFMKPGTLYRALVQKFVFSLLNPAKKNNASLYNLDILETRHVDHMLEKLNYSLQDYIQIHHLI